MTLTSASCTALALSPGKMRQLMVAVARWRRAFWAWVQIYRRIPLNNLRLRDWRMSQIDVALASTSLTTPLRLDEESLRRFDAEMPAGVVDDVLLHTSPRRDLVAALAVVVTSLRAIDVEAVARKQGWLSRLTGADLEAAVLLERACRNLDNEMTSAGLAAKATEQSITLMRKTHTGLGADQECLDALVLAGHAALALEGATVGPDLRARFERRVANAAALHAANTLAAAQLQIAIAHAGRLLDRFADVEKLLFPVWRRHAMAVAAAPAADGGGADSHFETLKSLHARFIAGATVPLEAVPT
jgi:hypothetical protein